MNDYVRAALAAAALAAAGTTAVILTGEGDTPIMLEAVEIRPRVAAKTDQANWGESRVAFAKDGTKMWVVEVVTDGSREVVQTVAAPCARKPKGAKLCTLLDGGDPGELNRYPAAEFTGTECEGVACAVLFGFDPDAPEAPPMQDTKP